MPPSEDAFEKLWVAAGEDQAPQFIEAACQRYQRQQQSHVSTPEASEPNSHELNFSFDAIIPDTAISDAIKAYQIVLHNVKRIPWTTTGIEAVQGIPALVFATGRVWRSLLHDLYLKPQFALWLKIGINSETINSMAIETLSSDCLAARLH